MCRWSAEKLLTHAFFKQCRSTNIFAEAERSNFIPINPSEIKELTILDSENSVDTRNSGWSWIF